MSRMNDTFKRLIVASLIFTGSMTQCFAQNIPTEEDYYKIATVPSPEGVLLEVGGLATLPDGRVALCTRRGDVWVLENATSRDASPGYTLFATGLHEPLGLAYRANALYAAQRGELTKLVDSDGDGKADIYETVYAWPISGHYHEYSFGPKIAPDGSFFVTGNVAFGDQEWWRGESKRPWRGWTMKIHPDGVMEPWASGMRSPCGLGMIDGEFFYDDNQGDWMGSGGIWHVRKGSFTGHPAGLAWSSLPNSPVKITAEQFRSRVDERRIKAASGNYIKPENIADEKNPNVLFALRDELPGLTIPSVWLPHGILGISNSEILQDGTDGKFGPFAGQIFVGDQGQSKIMRVVMEEVKGELQGVAFDFRSGFQSGVLRMSWGQDGSLFVGETNRGWGSAGTTSSGLQFLKWTGEVPMEMKTVRAMPDGFEIEFTKAVEKNSAEDIASYGGRSFIYKYHPVYGSPIINESKLVVKGVKVSDDGMKVRIVVDNLRQYYIHELNVDGIRSRTGLPVLHASAYYTLNNIPEGTKLQPSELSVKKTVTIPKKPAAKSPTKEAKAVSYAEIEPLLVKNTCTACHQVKKRQVGPAFVDVAKRKYSNERIVQLIYNPEPKNWPEHETPMAPMPQVPKEEALKIAAWINSLRDEGSKPIP